MGAYPLVYWCAGVTGGDMTVSVRLLCSTASQLSNGAGPSSATRKWVLLDSWDAALSAGMLSAAQQREGKGSVADVATRPTTPVTECRAHVTETQHAITGVASNDVGSAAANYRCGGEEGMVFHDRFRSTHFAQSHARTRI